MAGQPKNTMSVQVLPDGTLKVETGDMSGASHQSADDFLKELRRLMGGTEEVQGKAKQSHHHHHGEDHAHH